MKINGIPLYRFLTTFCIVPVNDWSAFGQRLLSFAQRILIVRMLFKVGDLLFGFLKTPAYLALIVAALTYFPDTIQWIFFKIGEIQMTAFMLMLNLVMPEIFKTADGDYSSWKTIWENGINNLPSDWVAIMNGLGVGELLGLITSTLMSGWIIRIYRKTMLRAGLL